MALFEKKTNSVLGVDLGSHATKLVELRSGESHPRLVTYGVWAKEQSSAPESNPMEAAAHLRELLVRARVTTDLAVGSLPAANVFNTVMKLPQMPEKEIQSAVKWEAKKLLPLPLDRMSLHWHLLPGREKVPGSHGEINVLISAAPKDIIAQYLTVFKEANLRLVSLETELKALQRSLLETSSATSLIMDMGSANTNMIVFSDNIPIINKNIEIGGETIRRTISNSLSISDGRAEQLKSSFGLPLHAGEIHPVTRAIQFAVDNMVVQEIRRLQMVIQSTQNVKIDTLVITGGGSHIKNLPSYLERMLNIKVVTGDPWKKVVYPAELKPELTTLAPELTVAIGLALRGPAA